jgi:hypothetical protein
MSVIVAVCRVGLIILGAWQSTLTISKPVSGITLPPYSPAIPAPSPTRIRDVQPVIRTKSPADSRPFLPKAKLQNQEALEARYGRIAIQDVADALHHLRPAGERRAARA